VWVSYSNGADSIGNSDPPARQLFRLYFPRQFKDLRGKSSKQGLDKNCQNREAGLEALLVGSPGLAERQCDRRDWVVLSAMGIFRQLRRIICQLEPRITSCLPTIHLEGQQDQLKGKDLLWLCTE
jgi:hypothetical protein